MKKIIVVVEGPTEEKFVKNVLRPYFISIGISIDAQQWTTNRKLGYGGGGKSFDLIENHLKRLMSQYKTDNNVFFSTMIDLYAFPRMGNTVYDEAVANLRSGKDKALTLEQKMNDRMGYRFFIPYVQLYEFETLLLSKPESLSNFYTDKSKEINSLIKEIDGLDPELINETPQGAPSKRIIKYIPKYKKQKTTVGVSTAEAIGLTHLRLTCPHFNDWIVKLENIHLL